MTSRGRRALQDSTWIPAMVSGSVAAYAQAHSGLWHSSRWLYHPRGSPEGCWAGMGCGSESRRHQNVPGGHGQRVEGLRKKKWKVSFLRFGLCLSYHKMAK